MSPKVSVVIPCYNLGQYLEEAVESVVSQTFQDFEIVIVDDGSTEPATREMLARYDRPRTRVVRSENRGLPAARNLGIQHSSGPYVCCLDADDKLERTNLEKAVRILDEQPSITFVSHWLKTFGIEEVDWTPTECDLRSMLGRNQVNGAALVRRDAIVAVGGFDESMAHGCEDWNLWLTLLERGFAGTIIPEILFFYRRRPDSMSRLMMNGDTHNQLLRGLAEKHEEAYRRHLLDLVFEKESAIAHLCRENRRLELDVEYLNGLIQRRRENLSAIEVKAERAEKVKRQREELQSQRNEAAALAARALRNELSNVYASASWRITGPLRTVYGWMLRLRARQ
ncbi:MAG: glycosyltransferase family 2 protein [Vicinamibacterales bacterium]